MDSLPQISPETPQIDLNIVKFSTYILKLSLTPTGRPIFLTLYIKVPTKCPIWIRE